MIRITRTLAIDESEIQLGFIRASGPGGQNVNKLGWVLKDKNPTTFFFEFTF